jgi:hypothetical protein
VKTQAKQDLLNRLDADAYSTEDVVILTLPIALPYPVHNPGYERADGEIKYGGEYYQLVKQKVENDTLFMVCVRDHEQKHLDNTIYEYANLSNNLPAATGDAADLMAKLFKDYTFLSSIDLSTNLVLQYDLTFANISPVVSQHAFSVDSPPPELG